MKVGDKVYHIGYFESRDLIVTEIIDKINVRVRGVFVKEGIDKVKTEVEEEAVFRRWDLTLKDARNGVKIHNKNKWNDLFVITPNMGGVVKEIYEQVLTGKINMNPFYQRGLVWTLEQKQKYITALFNEKARINVTMIVDIHAKSDCYIEVLDGKQRLSTIFEFIENKFSLENGLYFEDLHRDDVRYFLNLTFHYTRMGWVHSKRVLSDKEKVELFLEINELGTKMSDEHLEKIKNMVEL